MQLVKLPLRSSFLAWLRMSCSTDRSSASVRAVQYVEENNVDDDADIHVLIVQCRIDAETSDR